MSIAYDEICRCKPTVYKKVDVKVDTPFLGVGSAVLNAIRDNSLLDGTWEGIELLSDILDYRVIKIFDSESSVSDVVSNAEHILFCSGWTGNELLFESNDGLHHLAFDNSHGTYTYDDTQIADTTEFAKRVYVYKPLYNSVSVTDDGNGTVTLSIK